MRRFLSVAARGPVSCTYKSSGGVLSRGFGSLDANAINPSVDGKALEAMFDKAFIHTNGTTQPSVSSDKERILVFYDGGCPLCANEIAFYDRLNRQASCRIAFINLEQISPLAGVNFVSSADIPRELPHLQQLAQKSSLNVPAAYRKLHVLREDGSIHTSAHAFCEMWQRLPYLNVLQVVVENTPGAMKLTAAIYEFFADKRMKWRLRSAPQVSAAL